MKKDPTAFDEFFIATVLADLFDKTGSDNTDFIAQKIVEGLQHNRLIKHVKDDDDDLLAA